MKWYLGADRRNLDRHIYKGKHGFCPPYTHTPPLPPQGSTAGMTHLFIPGPGGGSGKRGEDRSGGKRRGCMDRSCYTCQGGWLGQAAGGFCSKSDRLTSPSPLHEADTELANHECVLGE